MTYRTAAQLGISPPEYDGLLWLLREIVEGRIQECPRGTAPEVTAQGQFLDMATEYIAGSCGTLACIGGWVAAHMYCSLYCSSVDRVAPKAIDYVDGILRDQYHPLYKLYWQNIGKDVTPKHAATAIDNFLTCGDPLWSQAMPGFIPR